MYDYYVFNWTLRHKSCDICSPLIEDCITYTLFHYYYLRIGSTCLSFIFAIFHQNAYFIDLIEDIDFMAIIIMCWPHLIQCIDMNSLHPTTTPPLPPPPPSHHHHHRSSCALANTVHLLNK